MNINAFYTLILCRILHHYLIYFLLIIIKLSNLCHSWLFFWYWIPFLAVIITKKFWKSRFWPPKDVVNYKPLQSHLLPWCQTGSDDHLLCPLLGFYFRSQAEFQATVATLMELEYFWINLIHMSGVFPAGGIRTDLPWPRWEGISGTTNSHHQRHCRQFMSKPQSTLCDKRPRGLGLISQAILGRHVTLTSKHIK